MVFQDTYDITLRIEGSDFSSNYPVDMSFSMKDSIHSVTPKLRLTQNDFSGLFQEALFSCEGFQIDVQYGYKDDDLLKNFYIIESDEFSQLLQQTTLAANVGINASHKFQELQQVTSKAYKSRISDIIRQIASKYPFQNVVINDTGSFNTWYQPMMTDIEFIEKILLANSYSVNSLSSPFFCFITNRNEFHFRNYNSMFSQVPTETIKLLIPNMQDENLLNKVFDLKRFRNGFKVNFPMYHRKIYQLSKDNGAVIKDDVLITDNPSYSGFRLPIKEDNYITGYSMLPFSEQEKGRQESQDGQKIDQERNSMFLERFILSIPLNTKVNAGNVVNLEFNVFDENKTTKKSLYFSDKYLVESSNHVWDGQKKQGFTELMVSRKFVNAPVGYVLREKLMRT